MDIDSIHLLLLPLCLLETTVAHQSKRSLPIFVLEKSFLFFYTN